MDYKETLKPHVMTIIVVCSSLTGMALSYLLMMLFWYMLSIFPDVADTMGIDLETGVTSVEANK